MMAYLIRPDLLRIYLRNSGDSLGSSGVSDISLTQVGIMLSPCASSSIHRCHIVWGEGGPQHRSNEAVW